MKAGFTVNRKRLTLMGLTVKDPKIEKLAVTAGQNASFCTVNRQSHTPHYDPLYTPCARKSRVREECMKVELLSIPSDENNRPH